MMKVARKALTEHLAAVLAGGTIPEAAFSGPWAVDAIAEDNTALVSTPGEPDLGELPGEVGVLDLQLLVDILGRLPGDEVEVVTDGPRLVVIGGGSSASLVTADPEHVRTRLASEDMEVLRSEVSEVADPVPFGADVRGQVQSLIRVLGADDVAIEVSPEGAVFRIGHGTTNQADVHVPDLGDPKADAPYSLRFTTGTVANVLGAVGEGATIALSGPDSLVVIRDGAFTYYLSPLAGDA